MNDNTLINKLKLVERNLRSPYLAQHLAQLIGKYLHIENPIDFPKELSLFDLGLTSLQAVEIKYEIENLLSLPLESTIIFNLPTIDKLTKFLLEKIAFRLDVKQENIQDDSVLDEKEYALKMLQSDFRLS